MVMSDSGDNDAVSEADSGQTNEYAYGQYYQPVVTPSTDVAIGHTPATLHTPKDGVV